MPHHVKKEIIKLQDGKMQPLPSGYGAGCEFLTKKIDAEHRLVTLLCHTDGHTKATINLINIDKKTGEDAMSFDDLIHSKDIQTLIDPTHSSLTFGSNATVELPVAQNISDAMERVYADGKISRKDAVRLEAIRAEASNLFPSKNQIAEESKSPRTPEWQAQMDAEQAAVINLTKLVSPKGRTQR